MKLMANRSQPPKVASGSSIPGASAAEPESDSAPEVEQFQASARYWVLAIASLGASLLLIVDLFRGFHWDALLFAVAGGVAGLWALWMATTRVILTPDGLWVKRFSATYFVDNKQMLSADAQGRFFSSFTVAYHPRLDNGLLDTEHIGALAMPGLVDQGLLLERLEERIPD